MEERIKSSSRPTSTQANQKRPSSDGGEDCQEIEIINPIPIVLIVMERSVPGGCESGTKFPQPISLRSRSSGHPIVLSPESRSSPAAGHRES